MKKYKTFEDLEFKRHPNRFLEGTQAVIFFPNNYGASVVCGKDFYSNGVDTYEIACLYKGENEGPLVYPKDTPFENGVCGYCSKERITNLMKEIQDF